MRNALPEDRSQVRNDCRTNLDAIKESYKETRKLFRDTFKEFRESMKILVKEARGHDVSESEKQEAQLTITKRSLKQISKDKEEGVRDEIKELREKISKKISKKDDRVRDEIKKEERDNKKEED